jgi:hypothetical protein
VSRAPSLLRRASAGLLTIAVSASCAGIIVDEDYEDAAELLCDCDPLAPVEGCAELVRGRLENALEETRQKWLERFVAKNCYQCQSDVLGCFDSAPVCTAEGASCLSSVECCGSTKGARCCNDGSSQVCCDQCQTCNDFITKEPDRDVPICAESLPPFNGMFDCFCENCAVPCSNFCAGLEKASVLCGECFLTVTSEGGVCREEAVACATDT